MSSRRTKCIKGKLIGPKPSDSAAVTHVEFARAMVRILKGRGCTVWIGDSSGGGHRPDWRLPRGGSMFRDTSGWWRKKEQRLKNFDREGRDGRQAESGCEETMYSQSRCSRGCGYQSAEIENALGSDFLRSREKNVIRMQTGAEEGDVSQNGSRSGRFRTDYLRQPQGSRIRLHIMDGILANARRGTDRGTFIRPIKSLSVKIRWHWTPWQPKWSGWMWKTCRS